jgi:hypothetical protein
LFIFYSACILCHILSFLQISADRYHVLDVLDVVDGLDSEFSELSSDDELDDEWSYPDRSNGNTQTESGSYDFNLSDDEPLASLANQQDAAVESGYNFNNRRAFIPPSDLEFVDAEPEPIANTPYGYFKSFVTDDMFEHIALELNKYEHQKNGESLQTTAKGLETFVGLYFHMGIVKMVIGRQVLGTHRSISEDCFHDTHLQDNLEVTEEQQKDKAWKIRPWFDYLNLNFGIVSPSENQCVDEAMVAFKGRSYLKQFLPKKPKKWGLKLWARCSSTGFMHKFDIYQGKGTGRDDPDDVSDCGQGENVVIKLCASLPPRFLQTTTFLILPW